MKAISHSAVFKAQSDFALESKIVVGHSVWSEGVAGARLYEQVLAKRPGTVGEVIDRAAKLDAPFTAKAVMGHLKWIYTAGELTVDGTTFPVAAKVAKPEAAKAEPKPEPKPEPTKAEKPKAKAKAKAKVIAARKSVHVKRKAA